MKEKFKNKKRVNNMNLTFKIIVVVLVLLALSSGITKIMLMPQDVEFFDAHGFSSPMLIAFGACQIIGGVLMVISKLRMLGAITVAMTFLFSLALLVMDKNYPVAGVTIVAIILLLWAAKSRTNA